MNKPARRSAAKLHLLASKQVQHAADGDHADGGGLLLRVRGGSASWVLRYTAASGKRREMGLGPADRSSLSAAGKALILGRDLAHAARECLRRGVDPIDERGAARTAARDASDAERAKGKRQAMTLARAARDYHSRVIEPTRTSKHSAQWISSLENHVSAAVWHAPIADVTAPQLLAALLTIKPHERARNLKGNTVPETLRRIRQRLDVIFEDAIFHGLATQNPAAAIRRKLRETGPKAVKGQFAAMRYREVPALMQRIRAMPGTAARCLEFAVLAAARTSEVLLAEWSEFDLDAGTWTVPAARMKAKEAHTVYLSPCAVEILRRQVGQDARLVFPSPMSLARPEPKRQPLSNMGMLKVLERLGVRDRTTVHGLCRASFSTWANETAAARPDVIEACLAHREADRIRSAYNRAEHIDERRALLAAWADYLTRPALALVAA